MTEKRWIGFGRLTAVGCRGIRYKYRIHKDREVHKFHKQLGPSVLGPRVHCLYRPSGGLASVLELINLSSQLPPNPTKPHWQGHQGKELENESGPQTGKMVPVIPTPFLGGLVCALHTRF